jgi:Zn-dependent M32 family carboxypeptidase
VTDPKELERAKAIANEQLSAAKERTEETKAFAEWWREQRNKNNFRAMIEGLVRGI